MNNNTQTQRLNVGCHFVFEGLDGSGKSTQCRMLVDALQDLGYHVVATREPTSGPWGQKIRQMAQAGQRSPVEELEWFIHDRKAHIAEVIQPTLDAGGIVIQDRYFFSTMAYQGSQGLDPDEILETHLEFAPLPHRTFYLKIPADVGLQRVQQRQGQPDAFEKLDALQRCATIFDSVDVAGFLSFDAQLPPETLHEAIFAEAISTIRSLNGL